MLEVIPVPAFRDNYIWLLQAKGHAVVVDPGDDAPVVAQLQARDLVLDAILITHHHDDHTGGVKALLEAYPAAVYAPAGETYTFPHHAVHEGDSVDLTGIGVRLQVMETPGHTLDHVVYYGANSLFCGDTLFGCGCGRLFEGSCSQLYHSLQRLARLPAETRVYCAHEYTQHNIRFARTLDPGNAALAQREVETDRCRARGNASLPSSIGLERATNPFLRCETAAIQKATQKSDPEFAFCAIRTLRNSF
ncbi:hydroxyacylglutathione hydrolase [mine drainage metagenome]|uniref:hydroxyacylglutathione hydrolase n=1 Tax=mine drainage metagenome TaxID=410659 RepID=A0A1J5QSX3_9ZZZZ